MNHNATLMNAKSEMKIDSKKGFFSNFKEQHPKATKAIVTGSKFVGGVVLTAAAATVSFVAFNKPAVGKDCSRVHLTKFGTPKVGYKTPQRANFQVIKDAVVYQTIMHPYECPTCGKFHVGHKH